MSAGPTIGSIRGDARDVARWRRLAVIALVLVVTSTVLLTTMLAADDRTALVETLSSAPAPASTNAVAAAAGAAKNDPGDTAAPARPRVYSPVDVRTLAAARAHGNDAPPPVAIAEDADEAVTAEDSRAVPIVVPATTFEAAPVRVAPSAPARSSASKRASTPPVVRQASDRTRRAAPAERSPDTRIDARAMAPGVPRATEPLTSRDVPEDIPRQQKHDASAAALDAAWDRREQWMRERLRQR